MVRRRRRLRCIFRAGPLLPIRGIGLSFHVGGGSRFVERLPCLSKGLDLT